MVVHLGNMAMGTWVWDSIPAKHERRWEAPKIPVSPCGNKDVHEGHFYSWGGTPNVCHGVKHPLPTEYVLCQEVYPQIQELLPCKYKESGGYQCENLEPHTDEHKFGEHTIRHSLAGNGWSCEQIDETP